MNREHKFMAWDGIDYMSKPFTLQDLQEGKIQFTSNTIIREFTGLLDKNGKEIFEGDVVVEEYESSDGETKALQPIDVTFNEGAFYPVCTQPSTTFEVIGNIYSNPELLQP